MQPKRLSEFAPNIAMQQRLMNCAMSQVGIPQLPATDGSYSLFPFGLGTTLRGLFLGWMTAIYGYATMDHAVRTIASSRDRGGCTADRDHVLTTRRGQKEADALARRRRSGRGGTGPRDGRRDGFRARDLKEAAPCPHENKTSVCWRLIDGLSKLGIYPSGMTMK